MTDPNGSLRRIEDNLTKLALEFGKFQAALSDVPQLRTDVRKLQDAETRREGALGMFSWLMKNGPGIVGMTFIFTLGALAKWVLVK